MVSYVQESIPGQLRTSSAPLVSTVAEKQQKPCDGSILVNDCYKGKAKQVKQKVRACVQVSPGKNPIDLRYKIPRGYIKKKK